MEGFSVIYRNPGHWDIYSDRSRSFCIRGDIGRVFVRDERSREVRQETPVFKTVAAAFAYISDVLMFEPLASDGDCMMDSEGHKLLAVKE